MNVNRVPWQLVSFFDQAANQLVIRRFKDPADPLEYRISQRRMESAEVAGCEIDQAAVVLGCSLKELREHLRLLPPPPTAMEMTGMREIDVAVAAALEGYGGTIGGRDRRAARSAAQASANRTARLIRQKLAPVLGRIRFDLFEHGDVPAALRGLAELAKMLDDDPP